MRALHLHLVLWAVVASSLLFASDDAPLDVSSMNIQQLMELNVVSASLHQQGVRDAPAQVTVITDGDIRQYGYRTLAEALNSAPGFYVTSDRIYGYLGARGVSTPGDFGTRYLLMINGHPMADPLYDASSIDQSFGIDMSLIKQIEVVHGPGSALYGSNAVLCTINVITKPPVEMPRVLAESEYGSLGEKKLHLAYSGSWHGIKALVSGSIFNDSGAHSLYLPAYDAPETNFGRAIDMDGQRGYHLFSNVNWNNWTFTVLRSSRVKLMPVSPGDAIFNDRGTRAVDNGGFLEAGYTRKWTRTDLDWRLSYNDYRYDGLYRYAADDDSVIDNRELDSAKWASSKLTFRVDTGRWGTTTVGAEVRFDFQALQSNFDVEPAPVSYIHINDPDRTTAFFAQQEFSLAPHWKVVAGARVDVSKLRDNSIAPRVALIWQPSPRLSAKFLYGSSFRNPNAFELYFADGLTSAANPNLHPERGNTFEVVLEKRLLRNIQLTTSAYRTDLSNLIVAGRENELVQFQNASGDRLLGGSAEIASHWIGKLDLAASVAIENAIDADSRNPLPNSPRQLAKLRFAIPLHRYLTAAGAMNWVSRRDAMNAESIPGVLTSDVTLTTVKLAPDFDLQAGVRNLFNRQYVDPVALNGAVTVMPQEGRTLFVRLLWHRE